MVAAETGDFVIVKQMVKGGVDIDFKNTDGSTAIDMADTQEIKDFLEYELECIKQGYELSKRVVLIFVGAGSSGKTTLLHRLLEKTFYEGFNMTDGIDLVELKIGEIEAVAFDFAGQKDYAHSHSLFFNEEALYIAVINPRGEDYFLFYFLFFSSVLNFNYFNFVQKNIIGTVKK